MNGTDHRDIWDQINWLRDKAIRQEEKMSSLETTLQEIKGLLKEISAAMVTRASCEDKHGRLQDSLAAHLERTEGRASRLWEKLLGWALIAAASAIVTAAVKGAHL